MPPTKFQAIELDPTSISPTVLPNDVFDLIMQYAVDSPNQVVELGTISKAWPSLVDPSFWRTTAITKFHSFMDRPLLDNVSCRDDYIAISDKLNYTLPILNAPIGQPHHRQRKRRRENKHNMFGVKTPSKRAPERRY
jgi:hypothetical protein